MGAFRAKWNFKLRPLASPLNERQQSNAHAFHYDDMPVKYTAIFHCCKNDNFQMRNCDIFLIFAQNIDCGYTLEPPQ